VAELAIRSLGDRGFQVVVTDRGRRTMHIVTVPEELIKQFGLHDDVERLVRESFRFLLEREPASSILSRFSLSDISRYFPEYGEELTRRLT
jgi:hypothetical protein